MSGVNQILSQATGGAVESVCVCVCVTVVLQQVLFLGFYLETLKAPSQLCTAASVCPLEADGLWTPSGRRPTDQEVRHRRLALQTFVPP